MNKQNPNKRGIETLLSDEELLGYMLAPERRDFARREHKRVRREVEDLEVKVPLPRKITVDVPNNHLKYAITWYSIAISILLYYLYFRKKK